jgi:hypothetical protein
MVGRERGGGWAAAARPAAGVRSESGVGF